MSTGQKALLLLFVVFFLGFVLGYAWATVDVQITTR